MSTDDTRRRGFLGDLTRQARGLPLDALRVLDRIASRLVRRQQRDLTLTLETMRAPSGDPWGRDLDDDGSAAFDDAIAKVAEVIEAEDAQHEQARDEGSAGRSSIEPECPGPDCLMCNGAACNKCGAGCWGRPAQPCEHDSMDRHEAPDVPVDSDAPAATFGPAPGYPIVESERPAIRVVVDEPAEVDERGEGG